MQSVFENAFLLSSRHYFIEKENQNLIETNEKKSSDKKHQHHNTKQNQGPSMSRTKTNQNPEPHNTAYQRS